LDPLGSALNIYGRQSFAWAAYYSIIPYEFFLYIVKIFVGSPTNLISFTRGIHLSLAFVSIFLIVRKFLSTQKSSQENIYEWVSIVSGIVYVYFLTPAGWTTSLETHYQGFLNPLMFYLLLQYALTSTFWYGFIFLIVSILFSGNFGFSAMPQVMSFYPLAMLFLWVILRFVLHVAIPWRKLLVLAASFIGLHFFHLFPTAATLMDTNTIRHAQVFSSESIALQGVHYFDVNHEALGKISTQLFAPEQWNQSLLALVIPSVLILGFMKGASTIQIVASSFFALTLFLVSANITQLGVTLYRMLFYIPGFMMFRSFNDKWYYVYIFFYTMSFAASLYALFFKRKKISVSIISISLIVIMTWRVLPFFQGKAIDTPYYQSNSVSPIFKIDPNLEDSISYIKSLPSEGKFLTLPLTFPYFQIAYGREGGAYVGVSMVSYLGNRADYPGFWSMGPNGQFIFDAIATENWPLLGDQLASMNVRYIFHNADMRIMDNFPAYPYVYPGMIYSSKDQLPAIASQDAYRTFLEKLPLRKIYSKGFYSIYEINYPNPPVFSQSFETPISEQRYFFFGRVVSIVTFILLLAAGIGLILKKSYEKK
jgi:hypothetical protein